MINLALESRTALAKGLGSPNDSMIAFGPCSRIHWSVSTSRAQLRNPTPLGAVGGSDDDRQLTLQPASIAAATVDQAETATVEAVSDHGP
jgi:hypothetical protein